MFHSPPALAPLSPGSSQLSSIRLIGLVARTELLGLRRDGRLPLLGGLAFVLLAAALAFGWRDAARSAQQRADAQRVAESHWREQDDKNPHVAAHYGMWVFRPGDPLAAIDPGLGPYLGVALKLEAHRQNLPVHASAEDSVGIQRFGPLSAASVLHLLGPLIIAALGFSVWSAERERGTLRMLASAGVSPLLLLAGKSLALAVALAVVLVPAALLAASVLLLLEGGALTAALRLGGLMGATLVYYGAWAGVVLGVSARASNSRVALVALVAIWGVTSLAVPRLAVEIAAVAAPLPSQEVFAADVRQSLEEGLNGTGGREERTAQITQALLAEQGFEDADLFVDDSLLSGAELRAEAAFEDEVFGHHVRQLLDRFEAQERAVQWAGLASPLVAMRSLSMAFCGTDFAHHRHFSERAEQHRRALVDMLNRDFAENAGGAGWDYRAGKALWESAPPFDYRTLEPVEALRGQGPALISLAIWLALAWVFAIVASRSQRVF